MAHLKNRFLWSFVVMVRFGCKLFDTFCYYLRGNVMLDYTEGLDVLFDFSLATNHCFQNRSRLSKSVTEKAVLLLLWCQLILPP